MITFLAGVILILIGIILFMAHKWPKTIELSDIAPKEDTPKNR